MFYCETSVHIVLRKWHVYLHISHCVEEKLSLYFVLTESQQFLQILMKLLFSEQNHEVACAEMDTCGAAFIFVQNKEHYMTTGLWVSDSTCKILAL